MHYWPGITPFNIYDLTFSWFSYLVASARAVIKAREKAAKG